MPAHKIIQILLVGSSHVRLFYPYVREYLKEKAAVSTLPYDAGRTDEILESLARWPVENKDIIYLYAGHRDLMSNDSGKIYIGPELFRHNLRTIIDQIMKRTAAVIVLSTIPPVSHAFLCSDRDRNNRIQRYNEIIANTAEDKAISVHDFWKFAVEHPGGEKNYSDGLHFAREFYRDYAKNLAGFLINIAETDEGKQ